jgi:hypothetical protein
MKAFEHRVEPFVVACESMEVNGPREASLHHLSARQQREGGFSHGAFDHYEPDAWLWAVWAVSARSVRCSPSITRL